MADKKKAAEAKAAEKAASSAKADKKTSDKKTSDKKPSEKKPSIFSRIAKYFRECKSEIKKIVWPTPKATFKNMGIVLVVLIVIGLFIYALDTGLLALLGLVMNV